MTLVPCLNLRIIYQKQNTFYIILLGKLLKWIDLGSPSKTTEIKTIVEWIEADIINIQEEGNFSEKDIYDYVLNLFSPTNRSSVLSQFTWVYEP